MAKPEIEKMKNPQKYLRVYFILLDERGHFYCFVKHAIFNSKSTAYFGAAFFKQKIIVDKQMSSIVCEHIFA